MSYFLFGSVAQNSPVHIAHKQAGMERTNANCLVPFHPLQQGRNKSRHTTPFEAPSSSSNIDIHGRAISYTVGFVSSTGAQIDLSYTWYSRKRAFSTQLFSTEFFDWGIQSKNLAFRLDLSVEKLSRNFFSPVFATHRIAHPTTKHTPTRPHTHTRYHTPIPGTTDPYQVPQTHTRYHRPIPGTTQQYHTTAPTLPWLSLLLLLAASQRGALLAPLASSVYHTTAVARVIDAVLPTTATPPVAWAALG